ncbi:MAG: hypothetical protein C0392_09055 [Syntrophus sp. (in: bacteria)]|nr:hypothetical protein [Syntrophus sp. (in: bacteria)]
MFIWYRLLVMGRKVYYHIFYYDLNKGLAQAASLQCVKEFLEVCLFVNLIALCHCCSGGVYAFDLLEECFRRLVRIALVTGLFITATSLLCQHHL